MLKEPRSQDICCHFWKYATFLLILFPIRVVVLLSRALARPHTCIAGITCEEIKRTVNIKISAR